MMLPSQLVGQLQQFRRLLISLLNTVDDILCLPRTIPMKAERQTAKRVGQL